MMDRQKKKVIYQIKLGDDWEDVYVKDDWVLYDVGYANKSLISLVFYLLIFHQSLFLSDSPFYIF